MLIESYNVNMESASSFVQQHESSVSRTLVSQRLNDTQNQEVEKNMSISTEYYYSKTLVYNSEDLMSAEDRIKKLLIEILLGKFQGKKEKFELFPFANVEKNKNYDFNPGFTRDMNINTFAASYESTEIYYQKSSIDFSSSAQINTKNGSFNIDLNLSFSQEFYEQHKTKIDIAGINLQDPLIINYEGETNQFDNISRNLTFEFDLNSDGIEEEIPLLKKGSGFLVLDKNNNNKIDNGKELFGPNSGDGFEELRAYDEDGNNWIDEADSIFNNLKIWQIDEKGENKLITMSQSGIGAIYLSSIATGFNYSDGYADQTASLKESSIFLKENGEAGVVTSVDLVV